MQALIHWLRTVSEEKLGCHFTSYCCHHIMSTEGHYQQCNATRNPWCNKGWYFIWVKCLEWISLSKIAQAKLLKWSSLSVTALVLQLCWYVFSVTDLLLQLWYYTSSRAMLLKVQYTEIKGRLAYIRPFAHDCIFWHAKYQPCLSCFLPILLFFVSCD